MHSWRHFLPHFWVLLSHSDGMPPACATGLHAFAPELPQLHEHQQEAQGIQKSRDEHHVLDLFSISERA